MNRLSTMIRQFGGLFFNRAEIRPRAYPLELGDYQKRPLSNTPTVRAADIPKAYTPAGLYPVGEFPTAVLAESDEALSPEAPDLRGVWHCIAGRMKGHVERIEQAGNRVTITAGGVIHDMFVDGTVKGGVNDVNPAEKKIRVAADFKNGELRLRPGGRRLVAVNRYLAGDELIWRYGPFRNRLIRLTEPLPEWLEKNKEASLSKS
ncbi:MAG: hypothetical protein AAF614_34490 [Chloroflexota bacterium]